MALAPTKTLYCHDRREYGIHLRTHEARYKFISSVVGTAKTCIIFILEKFQHYNNSVSHASDLKEVLSTEVSNYL